MNKTAPKSMRLQIGIFGRINVGKSSFLNMIASQDVAIVSPVPGTTTDVVEKSMELRPVGPAVFLDTAGIDDRTSLARERLSRTAAVFKRADVFVVLTEEGVWGDCEKELCEEAVKRGVPVVAVVNKADIAPLSDGFRERLLEFTPYVMSCACVFETGAEGRGRGGDLSSEAGREAAISAFREIMIKCVSGIRDHPQTLVSDLIPPGGLAVFVVPIDSGAPKGRLILPQAHAIRDVLDGGGIALTVRDREYAAALAGTVRKPDIVVCDSQVVKEIAALTPSDIPLTTFSILFARLKGDLALIARGAAAIDRLKDGDAVLIAEACAHHAAEDDIGRVKIPRWLKEYTGRDLKIETRSGRDYPEDLERYALIIHCGACMLTSREMRIRSAEAVDSRVPITNYGMAISYMRGVFDRVMKPFGL